MTTRSLVTGPPKWQLRRMRRCDVKLGTHRLKPRRAFGRSERTGASGDNSGARSFEASSDLHEVRMKTYFGLERTWAPNPAPHGKAIVSSPQCVKSRDIVNRCLATLFSGFYRGLRVVGCLWVGRVVCRWARLRCGPGIALRLCGSFLAASQSPSRHRETNLPPSPWRSRTAARPPHGTGLPALL